MKLKLVLTVLALISAASAVYTQTISRRNETPSVVRDIHSYSNPHQVRTRHVDLDWTVNFVDKKITGAVTLTIERIKENAPLMLDTRSLKIIRAEVSTDGKNFKKTEFAYGATDNILGTSLMVHLSRNARSVRVFYETNPNASGLQWLLPEQTAGKKEPFMFSQAQAIHARSFIPLQDSPQVRVTYSARVRTPKNLVALMSAEGNTQNNNARNGDYRFNMPHAIPPYLIAIAVGDMQFKSLGTRTGVYTESAMLEKSAYELADTEKMVEATEKTFGAYRWGRYDLLVLPPSFPFGGMENPMLTFATPTILAGDRSLVSLVAHELAHSWSGNLVTNATWRDFWLNEGFTTYLERRIIEAVYGVPRREMEAKLGRVSLEEELAGTAERDQILHVNLDGRDPDEGFTGIPYEKGALFLRWIEESVGREKFDKFLRGYFDKYAFQSITTKTFVNYLIENLGDQMKYADTNPERDRRRITPENIHQWIEEQGLPESAPHPQSDAFAKVEASAKQFADGTISAEKIDSTAWTTQEWLHFLKSMPAKLSADQMSALDKAYGLTKRGNSEIAFQWLLMSIRNNYAAADARLEEFLTTIGRRKFVKPLFEELMKTPNGAARAKQIYGKARSGYHPITQATIDAVVR